MDSYNYLKALSVKEKKVIKVRDSDIESSLLAFMAGSAVMHIRISEIKEILPKPEVMPIGHAKRWLEGLIKVQGDIYSAVNLCRFLYQDGSDSKSNFALALLHDSGNYALLVDRVIGIVKVVLDQGDIKKDGFLELYQVTEDNALQIVSVDDLIHLNEFIDVSIF